MRSIRLARIRRRTNVALLYLAATAFAIFLTAFDSALYGQFTSFKYVNVVLRRAAGFATRRAFSGIFLIGPFRFTMRFKRRLFSFLLIRLRTLSIVGRLVRLLNASFLTAQRFALRGLLTSSLFRFACLNALANISSASAYSFLTNAANASTSVNMILSVIQRAMISSVDRIFRIRATNDRVNDRGRLSSILARLLRHRIALLL